MLCVMGKGNCPFPCRTCDVPKDRLMDPITNDIPVRDEEYLKRLLQGSWGIYCKSVVRDADGRKRKLTPPERAVLDEIHSNSIHPIMPAFLELRPPFEGDSHYMLAPPDIMHTLIGLMVNWVSLVIVICAVIAEHELYKDSFNNNLGHLDDAIASIPLEHSFPYKLSHFRKGVTVHIPQASAKNSGDGGGISGVLGMMNHQEVPGLVFQILLCKLPSHPFICILI